MMMMTMSGSSSSGCNAQTVKVGSVAVAPKTFAENLALVRQLLLPAERKPLSTPKPPTVQP